MGVLDSRKTYNNLKKKGFVDADGKSKDHIRVEFWHNGKLTRCRTKLSHNGQELNDYLISQMSKQISLSKSQFVDFAECKLKESDYVEILKSKKII